MPYLGPDSLLPPLKTLETSFSLRIKASKTPALLYTASCKGANVKWNTIRTARLLRNKNIWLYVCYNIHKNVCYVRSTPTENPIDKPKKFIKGIRQLLILKYIL